MNIYSKLVALAFTTVFFSSSIVLAHNKVVVIPLDVSNQELGPKYDNTIIVGGDKSAIDNGEALVAAILRANQSTSLENTWLIKLEAGVFDITNPSATAVINSGTHLQGAGPEKSIVRGGDVAISSEDTSLSDLAYVAVEEFDSVYSLTSKLTVKNVHYKGLSRGLRLLFCASELKTQISESTFSVNNATDATPDIDVISVEQGCDLSIDSSNIFGSDNVDGLIIGGGTLSITNSFLEDATTPLGGFINASCEGVSTLEQSLEDICP